MSNTIKVGTREYALQFTDERMAVNGHWVGAIVNHDERSILVSSRGTLEEFADKVAEAINAAVSRSRKD